MQLRTMDGNLTLGSVFKLFFWGWLLSFSAIIGAILLILVIVTLATGQVVVNGEVVHGVGPALATMLPVLVLFPVAIGIHALMFAGFLTFGVWLYKLWRPLNVVAAK